jgi:hypothetical protein
MNIHKKNLKDIDVINLSGKRNGDLGKKQIE